jgi:hypothetical protein
MIMPSGIRRLDHKEINYASNFDKSEEIGRICGLFDQIHPLQRKVKFLLDIRGYVKVNDLKGDYVEFGSYQSEMQYAAYHILSPINKIQKYIGLDSFNQSLNFTEEDAKHNTYEEESDFLCRYDSVKEFVEKYIGEKGFLIKGDFREEEPQKELRSLCDRIAISVIDCNLLSSTHDALEMTFSRMLSGGIIFLDDMFTNFSDGQPCILNAFMKYAKRYQFECIDYSTYPPFSKAFIVYSTKQEIREMYIS